MAEKSVIPEEKDEQLAFLEEASEADVFDYDEEQVVEDPVPALAGTDQPAAQTLDEDAELDSLDGSEEAAQGTQEPAPAVTEPPAAVEPVAEVPPPGQEAPVAAQEEQPAPVPASEPAPPPEEMVQVFNDWREKTENLLADHHYNLSQEQIDEFNAEPQRMIPKLMAKVYLDAVSAAIGQLTTHMPRLVRLVNEQDRANNEKEDMFFSQWPDLKQHRETVLKIGQAYRTQNPTASVEDFVTQVGAMAMVSLKLDPTRHMPTAPAAAQPFVPASQTPQGGTPRPVQTTNVFSQLAEEFEEDLDFD